MKKNNVESNVLQNFINYIPSPIYSNSSNYYIYFIFIFLVSQIIFNKIQETNKEICAICLSKIIEPVKPDCCFHIFCKNCFQYYAQSFESCPVCRKKFNKILEIYNPKNLNNYTNPFFDDISEEKLYRLSLREIPSDRCCVCKKENDKEFLVVCQKCGVNQSHYYCDCTNGIAIDFYMCPICRARYRNKLKNKK